MIDINILSKHFIQLNFNLSNKIKEEITWELDLDHNYYKYNNYGLLFTKSINTDDPNYCYLNDGITTKKENKIFESQDCLIAYIIALFY